MIKLAKEDTQSSLLGIFLHHFLLSLIYPRCGPCELPSSPSSHSAAVVDVYFARDWERAEGGTMLPLRNVADPTAERGSLHGGQPTPLPQTSQPPSTKSYTHAWSHKHAWAECNNLPMPASSPLCAAWSYLLHSSQKAPFSCFKDSAKIP